jgi:hypothetical protein
MHLQSVHNTAARTDAFDHGLPGSSGLGHRVVIYVGIFQDAFVIFANKLWLLCFHLGPPEQVARQKVGMFQWNATTSH